MMTKHSAQCVPGAAALRSRLALAGASILCAATVHTSSGGAATQNRGGQKPATRAAGQRLSSAAPRTTEELAQRIVVVSGRYLGTPYRLDPLGEGAAASPDPDPLICHTAVDCQTFVEQVLAEAMAPRSSESLSILTRIRYRGGVVGFGTRNHYMVTDWLPQNRWFLRDLTRVVSVKSIRTMEKLIDRGAFFRSRGAPELAAGAARQRSRTQYIPRAAVADVAARIPNGAVLIWVQDRPGIIAAHCGLAVRRADGALLLRHASQRQSRVVDEPLSEYLRRMPSRMVGLKVCQAVPPLDTASRRR